MFRFWSPIPLINGTLLQFNVLISDDGRALLTDFGFSRLENSSFSMASYTHGGVRGTIRWMAPEVLDGKDSKELMADTDVWSFGMTALVCSSFMLRFSWINLVDAGTIHP